MPGGTGALHRGVEQRRLAHARLTDEQQCRSRALLDAGDEGVELL